MSTESNKNIDDILSSSNYEYHTCVWNDITSYYIVIDDDVVCVEQGNSKKSFKIILEDVEMKMKSKISQLIKVLSTNFYIFFKIKEI